MPRIRRKNLPPALFRHLLDRIQQGTVPASQLGLLAAWLDTEPEIPTGACFKRFSAMTVGGEGGIGENRSPPGSTSAWAGNPISR